MAVKFLAEMRKKKKESSIIVIRIDLDFFFDLVFCWLDNKTCFFILPSLCLFQMKIAIKQELYFIKQKINHAISFTKCNQI